MSLVTNEASKEPGRADSFGGGVEIAWGLEPEPPEVDWLWHGYLALGQITLLTSQWKTGKTTLIALLLSRLKAGGALAELAVKPGRAVVISEEPQTAWRRRHLRANLDHIGFLCMPFRSKPTPEQWLGLIDRLTEEHCRQPLALVVFDTLGTFLPGQAEANAPLMVESLAPLRQLAEHGPALLLAHHPAKGALRPGQAARGTGALPSFTDINLEMTCYHPADAADRRRRILAHSRHEATPRHRLLELNPEGTDYLPRDSQADDFGDNWQVLRMVLEDAKGKRTRRELLSEWPADFAKPSDSTLYRWLRHGAAAGLICQHGTGRNTDPFRYWLPGMLEKWRQDPLYLIEEKMEEGRQSLEELWR